jgi:hypothetical protein
MDFAHTTHDKTILLKYVRRYNKSEAQQGPGCYRPQCGRALELSDRNGLVPHENEWYGRHEMRRDAKGVWLRKYPPARDSEDHENRQGAVFLALAAARSRMPGAGQR